jgi:copper chaperone
MENIMSTTINLKVTGMTCNHCVMHTTKALEGVNGVENVSVSLEEGSATVTGNADTEQLIAAVKEAGYEAEIN